MIISIIGAGNMGAALCKAFISDGVTDPDHVMVSDHSEEKLAKLGASYGVKTTTDNQEVLDCDVLLLAVKPQGFQTLAKEIAGKIQQNTLVISVMAGLNSQTIEQYLHHPKIIRAMPNTPVLVGEGVVAWYANQNIGESEAADIQKLLDSTGYAFRIESEDQIDDVTSLSGSGPGFFFYLFDQWQKAAEQLNIPSDQIENILLKTLKGSLTLLEKSEGESASDLSEKVASKGGATEQGLEVLAKAQFRKVFENMISATLKRCKELGQ